MDFLADGNVLLVGDGDFSFSVAVSKHPQFKALKTTSSSLESEESISVHIQAAENMATLKEMGVSVFLETDARELHMHEAISLKTYDRIIFNFPLADRHNIKQNRALLADFFLSCSQILSHKGQVMVTLCKGQGGTPADQPVRSWHDSWQIVAMATNAGFLLQSVVPFDSSLFPEYHSVGFRFQDKSFNTSGSLTHIFEIAEIVKDTDSGVRGTFVYDDCVYSCPRYIATKMERDLLSEPNNPMAILKNQLVNSFTSTLRNVSHVHDTSPVLPGFRSFAYVMKDNETDVCLEDDITEIGGKLEKERRNRETLEKLKKASFAHGVDTFNGAGELATTKDDSGTHHQLFLPTDDEAVYISIRTPKDAAKRHPDLGSGDGGSASSRREVCETVGMEVDQHAAEGLNNIKTQVKENRTDSLNSSPVFHHRVSLLENLSQICDKLTAVGAECSLQGEREIYLSGSNNSHGLIPEDTNQGSSIEFSNSNSYCTGNTAAAGDGQIPHNCGASLPTGNESTSCILTSGQCMLPGPICQEFLPVTQELMIVNQIPDFQTIVSNLPRDSHVPSNSANSSNIDMVNSDIMNIHDSISTQVASALHTRYLSHTCNCNISLQSCDSIIRLFIQGIDQSVVTNKIFLQHQAPESNISNVTEPSLIGHVVHVQKGGRRFHVTLLDIADFSCKLWDIEDKRLLWCTSENFLTQFQHDDDSNGPVSTTYQSLCHYPMKFAHDISFWENDDAVFNVISFCDVIRNVANDLVVQISLTDSYVDAVTKRRSRCYRLHFESRYQALPYLISWKLQSRIRMEVSRTLGVTLR